MTNRPIRRRHGTNATASYPLHTSNQTINMRAVAHYLNGLEHQGAEYCSINESYNINAIVPRLSQEILEHQQIGSSKRCKLTRVRRMPMSVMIPSSRYEVQRHWPKLFSFPAAQLSRLEIDSLLGTRANLFQMLLDDVDLEINRHFILYTTCVSVCVCLT